MLENNVDFEIAFTALLATVAVYVDSELVRYEGLIEVLAIALLIVTVVRRIGVMNELGSDNRIFYWTTDILSGISYIIVSYIFFQLSENISILLPVSPILIFIIVTPVSILAIVVAQTLAVGGGYFEESEDLFRAAADRTQAPAVQRLWRTLEMRAQNAQARFSGGMRQSKIREYTTTGESGIAREEKLRNVGGVLGILIPILIPVIIIWLVAQNVDGPILALAGIAVGYYLITGLTDNWYSKYGLNRLDDTGWRLSAVLKIGGLIFCLKSFPI